VRLKPLAHLAHRPCVGKAGEGGRERVQSLSSSSFMLGLSVLEGATTGLWSLNV
jgi:hypothetical protein